LRETVHIPDGFLSTGVWATLDAAAAPAVFSIARRAQRGFDESKVPLLGVMGAFVFAAQMINFPVGIGTTGHLVGGALLAFTLGPSAAVVVMAAIIAIQALVFQDGGILALGANVLNMGVLGVLAGYLPYRFWSGTRWRRASIFAGGVLSVMVSGVAALSELLISKVPMSGLTVLVSLGFFLLMALVEGAITLAVMGALEGIHPGLIRKPARQRSFALGVLSVVAVLLATVGAILAATAPDPIEKLGHSRRFFSTLFADYQIATLHNPWLSKATAGLAGVLMIYAACLVIGRAVARHRSV
jgi:cobalt/nickel transport system permease protein